MINLIAPVMNFVAKETVKAAGKTAGAKALSLLAIMAPAYGIEFARAAAKNHAAKQNPDDEYAREYAKVKARKDAERDAARCV